MTKAQTKTNCHWQEDRIDYTYPGWFTEGLFDPNNPVLVDSLCRLERNNRHRCVIFVDDGLLKTSSNLINDFKAYATAHRSSINLVADPIPVPGDGKIKSEIHFVEQMQQTLYYHHIDRHSYAIAVGGSGVLDAVSLVATSSY